MPWRIVQQTLQGEVGEKESKNKLIPMNFILFERCLIIMMFGERASPGERERREMEANKQTTDENDVERGER